MTETKTAFQTVTEEVNKSLIQDTRNDDTKFYKFADDAPAWIDKAQVSLKCHEALDDRFPDDWVYEQMYFITSDLCNYSDVETAEAAQDAMGDIADGLVDVYNMDRVKWLALDINNAFLCDEAAEEFGWDKDTMKEQGLYGLIGMGQYLAIERIGNALIECIEAEANERENTEEADD